MDAARPPWSMSTVSRVAAPPPGRDRAPCVKIRHRVGHISGTVSHGDFAGMARRARRPRETPSDLHFRVGLPGFEPGTS
jgi:hypothetical protein